VFSKKKKILSLHKKHNHRIKLEKNHELNHEYASLYIVLKEELLLIKKYFKKYLNKKFIKSSITFYILFILFVKKSNEKFRFCVNYRKLNAITKKNRYSIFFLAETIARLFKTKWKTKIDIRHAFNRICMHSKKNEDLTTFKIKYNTYKYLMMCFELINKSSIFQNFINDILINYLNEFIITYLNDIIVYNNSKKKHVQHVRKIL
jgi:hypothetical protein